MTPATTMTSPPRKITRLTRALLCRSVFALVVALLSVSLTPLAGAAEGAAGARTEDASKPPAAPGAATEETGKAPSPRTPKSAAKSAAKKSKSAKDGEIFRPTEEISEDFAVSFPVDI